MLYDYHVKFFRALTTFGYVLSIKDVRSNQRGGVCQSGHFTNKGVNSLRFCANIFYGRPLTQISDFICNSFNLRPFSGLFIRLHIKL